MNKATLSWLMVLVLASPGLSLAADDVSKLQKEVEELKRQNRKILELLDAGKDEGSKTTKGGTSKTQFGVYGELHYNNLSNQLSSGDDKKEIDLHHFILYIGHEISPNIRFWSELGVEHTSSNSDNGEVAIEQAYLEFDIGKNLVTRTGVIPVPVGLLNEDHEPTTFYGVERNRVETQIIPTTWREGGIMITGLDKGFSYALAVHSGLQTSAAKKYAIRDGRNAVREARADKPAYTLRLKWTWDDDLEIGIATQQQTDITQATDSSAGGATLIEAHVRWQKGDFAMRALYANWKLEGSGPRAVGADEQTGWYIEPSYKLSPKLGMFARYSSWDNQAGDEADSEIAQTELGFNYWPHPDVVIKMDYQSQDAPVGSDEYKGFNLGIGYRF